MKPTKSAANIIVNDSIAGVPASTDLLLFAPLPNVPLVTDAKHCTVAGLLPGLGLSIPAGEIVFGTGAGVTSNAGFTLSPTASLGPFGLSIFGVQSTLTSNNIDALIAGILTWTPSGAGAGAFALDIELSASGPAVGAAGNGAYISVDDNTDSGLTGGVKVLQLTGTNTPLTGAWTYLDIAGISQGVAANTGIHIGNIAGGTNPRAIVTGLGPCEFGDTVKAQGYKAADGSDGIAASITTAGLVGKTITVKNGLITAFA